MLLSSRELGNNKPFQFIASSNLKFNASIEWDGSGPLYYILNWGACLGLCDAAMTISAHSDFCEAYGKEMGRFGKIEDIEIVRQRFCDYRSPENREDMCSALPLPTYNLSQPREHLGDVLFDLTTAIVSLHEQGHALCGHLHFAAKVAKSGFEWYELESNETSKRQIDQATAYAFELQADAFAFEYLLIVSKNEIIKQFFPDSPLFADGNDGRIDWIFFVTMAGAIVFSILEKSEQGMDQLDRRHPPAKTRMLAFMATLKKALQAFLPDETQRNQFLVIVYNNLFVVFEVIDVSPIEREAFNEYFSKTLDDLTHPSCLMLKDAIECLNRLEPELKPLLELAHQQF